MRPNGGWGHPVREGQRPLRTVQGGGGRFSLSSVAGLRSKLRLGPEGAANPPPHPPTHHLRDKHNGLVHLHLCFAIYTINPPVQSPGPGAPPRRFTRPRFLGGFSKR